MSNDHDFDPMMAILFGAIMANNAIDRAAEHRAELARRERLHTDPVFRARYERWQAYDDELHRRTANRLSSAGQVIGASALVWIGSQIAWAIILSLLDAPLDTVFVWAPPVALAAFVLWGLVEDHRMALASLTTAERRLVHHHRGHWHVHEHRRRHGHHALDDPPVPPTTGRSNSAPEPWLGPSSS